MFVQLKTIGYLCGMKNETKIMIKEIKEQTGLTLIVSQDLTKKFGKRFFTVEIKDNFSESNEVLILQQFSNKYKTIAIEPNGFKKLAIFIL